MHMDSLVLLASKADCWFNFDVRGLLDSELSFQILDVCAEDCPIDVDEAANWVCRRIIPDQL